MGIEVNFTFKFEGERFSLAIIVKIGDTNNDSAVNLSVNYVHINCLKNITNVK